MISPAESIIAAKTEILMFQLLAASLALPPLLAGILPQDWDPSIFPHLLPCSVFNLFPVQCLGLVCS
jgi:hypothetical protein